MIRFDIEKRNRSRLKVDYHLSRCNWPWFEQLRDACQFEYPQRGLVRATQRRLSI